MPAVPGDVLTGLGDILTGLVMEGGAARSAAETLTSPLVRAPGRLLLLFRLRGRRETGLQYPLRREDGNKAASTALTRPLGYGSQPFPRG